MLRSINICRSKLKINNSILCNNKYATYSGIIKNRQNWANFSTVGCIIQKIKYPTVVRYNATDSKNSNEEQAEANIVAVTRKERLKKAVKEYGTTVIVFHVCISLISLGICYVIVSAGLDVEAVFMKMGFTEDATSKLATKTGTFVAAYAFHKIFAPVRISITLASTPFIVKYLRNIGWLKIPIAKEMRQIK